MMVRGFLKRHAFSLVELSVVLIILGLLVGGIVGGRSLIKSAELRSITSEAQSYLTAVSSFREQYSALPGDMANATDYWGAVHATPATCRTTTASGSLTCNGNGDGRIASPDGGTTIAETYHIWIHLKNAGLTTGTFTGVAGPYNVWDGLPGVNVPASKKLTGAGYGIWYFGYADGSDLSVFAGDYGNSLVLGSDEPQMPNGPIIAPEDMASIDTKFDDGLPGSGSLRAYKPTSYLQPDCATTTDPATSRYELGITGKQCTLVFANYF